MSFMKIIIVLLFMILIAGLVENSFAHTAKVLEDLYKIDVGWKKEPPITGESNAIEIIITIASEYDKKKYDKIFGIDTGVDHSSSKDDVTGLSEQLEVEVKVGEDKSFVTLSEDAKILGVYYGDYTPMQSGQINVHLYGVIGNFEFESTFHPEKIEQGEVVLEPTKIEIPEWIKNNAGWWADDQIEDSDFVLGIQYLIKEKILEVPKTESSESIKEEIPDWVKNNAGWWAEGQISDDDFIKGIQFLIKNGIMQV